MLSSHAVDGHEMYSGGSVVGKASTIGIENRDLVTVQPSSNSFRGGGVKKCEIRRRFQHHSTLSRPRLKMQQDIQRWNELHYWKRNIITLIIPSQFSTLMSRLWWYSTGYVLHHSVSTWKILQVSLGLLSLLPVQDITMMFHKDVCIAWFSPWMFSPCWNSVRFRQHQKNNNNS